MPFIAGLGNVANRRGNSPEWFCLQNEIVILNLNIFR